MRHLSVRKLTLSLGIMLVTAGCTNAPPMSVGLSKSSQTASATPPTMESAPTSTVSDATTSNAGLAAGWGIYTNNEDHYVISYADAADVLISHPADSLGMTTIGWSTSSLAPDYVQIEVVQTDTLNLSPNTPQQWVADQRHDAGALSIPTQDITGQGWSGFVESDSQTQTVTAILSVPTDYSVGYEITFVAGADDSQVPAFWRGMLDSFRIVPLDQGMCSGPKCAYWQ
jgi:hypothetical protein